MEHVFRFILIYSFLNEDNISKNNWIRKASDQEKSQYLDNVQKKSKELSHFFDTEINSENFDLFAVLKNAPDSIKTQVIKLENYMLQFHAIKVS